MPVKYPNFEEKNMKKSKNWTIKLSKDTIPILPPLPSYSIVSSTSYHHDRYSAATPHHHHASSTTTIKLTPPHIFYQHKKNHTTSTKHVNFIGKVQKSQSSSCHLHHQCPKSLQIKKQLAQSQISSNKKNHNYSNRRKSIIQPIKGKYLVNLRNNKNRFQ